jgi:hypothetical protein
MRSASSAALSSISFAKSSCGGHTHAGERVGGGGRVACHRCSARACARACARARANALGCGERTGARAAASPPGARPARRPRRLSLGAAACAARWLGWARAMAFLSSAFCRLDSRFFFLRSSSSSSVDGSTTAAPAAAASGGPHCTPSMAPRRARRGCGACVCSTTRPP